MSSTQKILLFCSAICYALVLIGFFFTEPWMILIFFILHSLSLLYFTYISKNPSRNMQVEEELEQLKEHYSRLTEENTKMEKQLEERSEKISALESELLELQSLQEAAAKEPEPVSRNQEINALLPPLHDGEDPHETMDIIRIAQETIREFSAFSEKAGVQIRISSPSSTLLLNANAMRIRILFRNIIDNSIKYMNRSGSLVITISAVGDDIFIVLKDNGNGLPEEETAHIFELNYQGSNRISGNGLGLTQAKAIVEYYGGTIYAKSTAGKGMGIYIQLPVDERRIPS